MIQACVHHWVVEERKPLAFDRVTNPDGHGLERFSPATCKRCGLVRSFDNWAIEDQALNWRERSDHALKVGRK